MEKLIELLNEYETPRSGVVYKSYDNYDGFFYGVDCDGETEISWSDSLICSKKFGFIEWLVEHNKLLHPDFVQHLKLFYGDTMPEWNFYIMMLSIADKPIAELNKMLRPY